MGSKKGYATLIISLVVDLLFQTTDIHFLTASIIKTRIGSWKAFKKNGFIKIDEENEQINLNNGNPPLKPIFYPGNGGNYYLSRKKWETDLLVSKSLNL